MYGESALNANILIIDDSLLSVMLISETLHCAGFSSITSVNDSRKALNLYMELKPDLILLDLNMPYLDGYQMMDQFRAMGKEEYVPILVLTSVDDRESRIRALELGVDDFITKPFDEAETLTRIHNALKTRRLHVRLRDQNIELVETVRERTKELHDTRLEIIRRLSKAAEYRDNETGGHIIRMSKMCQTLSRLAGMTRGFQELILHASPMHDIGKIGIQDSILLKSGPLTYEEKQIMNTHTVIGANILSGHDSDILRVARIIALSHHEKWDGSGYPIGLKKTDIPVEGRIGAICDVFDAIRSKRPYKEAKSVDTAITEMMALRATHFDPELFDIFYAGLEEFVEEEKCEPLDVDEI